MTQFYRYRSTFGVTLWIEDLGNDTIRLGQLSITELAEHLQVGTSSIILDDPDADLGHSGDHIRGLQRFDIVETDEDADNQRVFFGYIGPREYTRGDEDRPSLRTGASRQITLSLVDLNCIPSFAMFPNDDEDADRDAETVDERMAWLLTTPHFSGNVYDEGLIESSSAVMDANNYQGQTAANVIGDMEIAAGFGWNAFMYFDEPSQHHALAFFNANTSTLYSSDLRISNDLADHDTITTSTFTTGTTFAASADAKLTRDPGEVVSRMYLAWRDGTIYRQRSATEDIFGRRDLAAPNTNITSATRATATADDFLFQHSTEADNISVKIEVPTSKVNHIRAGQRLQVKFTHLPGYESFTWCRVIRRTVIQEEATDRYILDLDLSPQEEAQPAGAIVQTATRATGPGGGTANFPNEVTVGNLLVFMGCKLQNGGSGPDAPNTDVALPRWGGGAWTDATPALTRAEWDDPRAYKDGMKLYWKIADSTSASCRIDEYTVSACWELSGSTMTGATIVSKDLQATSTTRAIGSLGTPAAGSVALLMVAMGAGAASPVSVLVSLNVGDWVRDIHGDGFAHVWESENNSIGFNQPAPPETWIGHQISDGTALSATVTDAHTHKWGGIALVLPPV